MAENRYVGFDYDQPVSNYVPLPLDAIYKIGQDADKKYQDSIDDVTKGTGLLSKHKTRANVKVYTGDPNNPVADKTIDYEPYRQKYMENVNKEMNSIIDDYSKDLNTTKYRQRVSALKGKVAEYDADLATKAANIENIELHNKELAKSKNYGQDWLSRDNLKYNTKYYNDFLNKAESPYQGYNIAEKVDRPKEIKETFGSLGEEVLTSFAAPDGQGYIREKYREGRTKDKIKGVFEPWYENSIVRNDVEMETDDYFTRNNLDPNAVAYQIKDDKGTLHNVTQREAFESQKIGELAKVALGYSTSKGKDTVASDATWKYLDGKKKDATIAAGLTGTNIEGTTFDLASLDPDFKSLRDKGIFKQDSKGNLKVNYGNSGIMDSRYTVYNQTGEIVGVYDNSISAHTKLKEMGGYFSGWIKQKKDDIISTEDHIAMAKQMDKMARAVGWYKIKDELKSDDYDTILNAYNLMAKARMPGEELNPVVSNLQSQKLDKMWENYQPYDPTNVDKVLADRPIRKEGDKVITQNRLTNSKGESVVTGVLRHTDGTSTHFAMRSNSKQEDMFFNSIGKIGSESANYMVGAKKPIGTEKIGDKLYKIVDEVVLPGTAFKVTTVADFNSSMAQNYVVEIPKDKISAGMEKLPTTKSGSKVVKFDNYGELQLFLNNTWYTHTSYGNSEVTESQSNQKQSENYR